MTEEEETIPLEVKVTNHPVEKEENFDSDLYDSLELTIEEEVLEDGS